MTTPESVEGGDAATSPPSSVTASESVTSEDAATSPLIGEVEERIRKLIEHGSPEGEWSKNFQLVVRDLQSAEQTAHNRRRRMTTDSEDITPFSRNEFITELVRKGGPLSVDDRAKLAKIREQEHAQRTSERAKDLEDRLSKIGAVAQSKVQLEFTQVQAENVKSQLNIEGYGVRRDASCPLAYLFPEREGFEYLANLCRVYVTKMGKLDDTNDEVDLQFHKDLETWSSEQFPSATAAIDYMKSMLGATVSVDSAGQEMLDNEHYKEIRSHLDSLEDRVQIDSLVHQTEDVLEKAEVALNKAHEAVGEAATSPFARNFADYGQRESNRDTLYTAITFVLVLSSMLFGYLALASSAGAEWQHQVTRLLIVLPLFAAAAYAARLASHHRQNARLAQVISTQLKTVNAYTEILSPDDAHKIRMELASFVFSRPDFAVESDDSNVSILPTDIVKLLDEAIDALGKKAAK
jgi:hypothetical protein